MHITYTKTFVKNLSLQKCFFHIGISYLLGLALALTLPPLKLGLLTPIALAGILWHAAQAPTPKQVAGRIWWSVFAMTTIHLWWLTTFLSNIFHFPPAGTLAFALYALEGGFFALMAYIVTRFVYSPRKRIWALAGGWGVVEYLRFLGPLAFPWPTLGYSLLPTPLIQVADLGGVLLASVLVVGMAAALATQAQRMRRRRIEEGLVVLTLAWLAALGYGLTRIPGEGPEQSMRVIRTTFDSFGRASGQLTYEQQLTLLVPPSLNRPTDNVVIWSETSLNSPTLPIRFPNFPGSGLSGLRTTQPDQNSVISLDYNGNITGQNIKAKLVPFGEEFPFYGILQPVYNLFEKALGIEFGSLEAAKSVHPLSLNNVLYGTYVCYDSVFPWVARRLVQQGAQLLVNPSNDGWYQGWGVAQHFWMGRVRAIEQRRWLVRSVNLGVAGAVNDLGYPVQTIYRGTNLQILDVRPKLLSKKTVYTHVGDWPSLILFGGMMFFGLYQRNIGH
jgi:apolipoprotein N-acyltransferase